MSSFSTISISQTGLQPGQWVKLGHYKESMPKEFVGPFKVINRDDCMNDRCRCFLMNFEGKIFDYCTKGGGFLGLSKLPDGYDVRIVSKEEILHSFNGKLEDLESKALDQLKKLAQDKYFGKGFDPDNEGKTLSAEEIRKKYGLTAALEEIPEGEEQSPDSVKKKNCVMQ